MTEINTATKIVHKLQNHGFVAVFAGGCVRDTISGKEPKDFDIATSATPDQIEELFSHTIPVGKYFGVMIVVENWFHFEVATLRKDSKASDGRHPDSVEYTTSLEEDAKRRDFAMNAIFFDPISLSTFDFFGGTMDINEKIIACVGEPRDRFAEDKLRMLRAIRFACTLGFDIEEYTWDAICGSANLISEVSMERIKMELDKILTSPRPVHGFELLKRCGILKEILPEVDVLDTVKQSKKWHSEGDVWEHTMDALNIVKDVSNDLDVLWAILLHDVGKTDCGINIDGNIKFPLHEELGASIALSIMNRFHVSASHKDAVVDIVGNHMRIKSADKMKMSKVRRLMAMYNFEKIKLASWADSKSAIPENPEDGINKFNWFTRLNEVEEDIEGEVELPKWFIGGRDLIEMGLTPSPLFSEILTEIMNLQLEGEINNREEALEFAKEKI